MLALVMQGSYRSRSFGVGLEEYKRVLVATVLAAGAVAIVCYVGKIEVARGYLAIAFPVGAAGLLLGRAVIRQWLHRQRRQGRLVHRVLVVGDSAHVDELVAVLRRESYLGFALIGACLPEHEHGFGRGDIHSCSVGSVRSPRWCGRPALTRSRSPRFLVPTPRSCVGWPGRWRG